jgi:hypothetical protein
MDLAVAIVDRYNIFVSEKYIEKASLVDLNITNNHLVLYNSSAQNKLKSEQSFAADPPSTSWKGLYLLMIFFQLNSIQRSS